MPLRMPPRFQTTLLRRVLTIPDAGHSIWGDNPAATAVAISTYLQTGDFDATQRAIDAAVNGLGL